MMKQNPKNFKIKGELNTPKLKYLKFNQLHIKKITTSNNKYH